MAITIQHTKESLSAAHIHAVAAMAGVNVCQTVYDYGVDGFFQEVAERNGRFAATGYGLDYQAKASTQWSIDGDCIEYDLESKTYNDIVLRGESQTTLILILLCLPKARTDWHGVSESITTLRNACFWHWFSGKLRIINFPKEFGYPGKMS